MRLRLVRDTACHLRLHLALDSSNCCQPQKQRAVVALDTDQDQQLRCELSHRVSSQNIWLAKYLAVVHANCLTVSSYHPCRDFANANSREIVHDAFDHGRSQSCHCVFFSVDGYFPAAFAPERG